MSQLTSDSIIFFDTSSAVQNYPMLASVTIYRGSAVGLSSGYARQLVSGDKFVGFAEETIVNSVATNGATDISVRASGNVQLAITSAAVGDIGNSVYASDGATFTYTAGGNSRIGYVVRWVSTGNVIVSFSGGGGAATTLTDSTTGTASTTLAAGAGVMTVPLYVNLADITAGALLTTYVPGYAFKVLGVSFGVEKAATTAAKLATITPAITGVSITGGVLALTSANCAPQGTVVAGSAVTALNTGAATDSITLTGSAVTSFVEGGGWILLKIQNMDTANAISSLAALL
jgi:hypothetical protein